MVTNLPLQGQNILVTRPEQQSAELAELIIMQGGQPILFPVMDIEPLEIKSKQLAPLIQADWLIFVSRNAVAHFVNMMPKEMAAHCQFAAVGNGTAQAMRDVGIHVHCQPTQSNGSDGLLEMPLMQQVSGKRVVIIRGKGGREHLAKTLIERGASIDYIEVYERTISHPAEALRQQALRVDKVLCTSVAGVDNLKKIMADDWLIFQRIPLVVVSDRIKQHAADCGFNTVAVAANASDDAVIDMLTKMDN
ncbi:MAG TPA: uroporphyrinogen-III synthase [Methylophaga aminisulfidivorans]|uniref:Uroporphyrinogen-III synthase n=1 Tax=Methylophaga aminisulfidivorans TaxID=230105 RepID=A0A7C1ZNJ6_9GAMM|nr:uroporphyrinogen-III synthase [Methylophaga aminisulfidivorans]